MLSEKLPLLSTIPHLVAAKENGLGPGHPEADQLELSLLGESEALAGVDLLPITGLQVLHHSQVFSILTDCQTQQTGSQAGRPVRVPLLGGWVAVQSTCTKHRETCCNNTDDI